MSSLSDGILNSSKCFRRQRHRHSLCQRSHQLCTPLDPESCQLWSLCCRMCIADQMPQLWTSFSNHWKCFDINSASTSPGFCFFRTDLCIYSDQNHTDGTWCLVEIKSIRLMPKLSNLASDGFNWCFKYNFKFSNTLTIKCFRLSSQFFCLGIHRPTFLYHELMRFHMVPDWRPEITKSYELGPHKFVNLVTKDYHKSSKVHDLWSRNNLLNRSSNFTTSRSQSRSQAYTLQA